MTSTDVDSSPVPRIAGGRHSSAGRCPPASPADKRAPWRLVVSWGWPVFILVMDVFEDGDDAAAIMQCALYFVDDEFAGLGAWPEVDDDAV